MKTFSLEGHPFIPLNQLLKLLGLVETGGEANNVIVSGMVKVNGETELQKRKKLLAGDVLTFGKETVKIIADE